MTLSAMPLPSDHAPPASPSTGRLARVEGGVGIRIKIRRDGRSAAADVSERDGYKVRFPRGVAYPEAVIINTGGGLAGGDRVTQTINVEDGARATVTTQAAERVYRALDDETVLNVRLTLGAESRLDWLPQETILFDRSRLARSIDVEMAENAQLLLAETLIFGRTAMGETIESGQLADRWRIRRGGSLIFAETIQLDGAIAKTLLTAPVAGGAHIVATALMVRPGAEDWLEPVRAALADAECETGASAWNGMLVLRALGQSSQSVRRMLERALPVLAGAVLPRVWQT